MSTIRKPINIYLLMTGGNHWVGGVQYTRNLIQAMDLLPKDEKPSVVLSLGKKNLNFGYEQEFGAYDFVRLEESAPWISIVSSGVRKVFGESVSKRFISLADRLTCTARKCTVAYPVKGLPLAMNIESVLWIPDFQYKCLPEYFSEEERKQRDLSYSKMLDNDSILVLSSESVRTDFERFFPEHRNKKVRILRFISVMNKDDYLSDPDEVCARYNLPDKFIYLPNQFFMHKRHDLVFLALAKLKRNGVKINLVCTGNSQDYRSQDYYTSLINLLHDNQLADQVSLLGLIPRADQIQIFRKAAFTLQPSIFEGWSTTVEDGIALGKEILLSDIATHKEQKPEYGHFFKAGCIDSLVDSINQLWNVARPGPDLERERLARIENRNRGLEFARTFLYIMSEADAKHCKSSICDKHELENYSDII
ncbi:glycosyltransferase [Methylobacter sp.]|uniref:glycosyltransferase n=1 Tax=Methylobacter sp. TaxID=2051955 RepID=UPI0012174434|nr:glycosyltransferase [Methylobacter sp.]TAK64233.1 MAG: glycosyltransferase [Methylobacter sp.]